MNDLISREGLINKAEYEAEGMSEPFKSQLPVLVAWLAEKIPSAEPEIIRCKGCRFAHLTYNGDCKYCDKWTDEFGIPEELYLDGDFFCGYAERRTDE